MAQRERDVARALGKIRDGSLLLLVAWILLWIGLAMLASVVLAAWAFVPSASRADPPELLARRVVAGWVVTGLVLVAVGVAAALAGLLAMFVPGIGELALARPEFGTASTLVKVGYLVWLVLLIVSVLLAVVRAWLLALPLGLVGFLFLLLGHVGAAVLCLKLNEIYPSALYLIAGVLLIVSIFTPLLAVVSWALLYVVPLLAVIPWVLLYIALGDTIVRARAQA